MQTSTVKEPVGAPAGANSDKEAQLHASLGQLLLRQERYAQAVNELTAALDARPNTAAWLASRAQAHQFTGAIDRAVDDAAAAVMAEPTNAEYAALFARILMRSGRHDEAVLGFSEAIRLDGSKLEYYEALAHALQIKGNVPAALELYEKLHRLHPQNEGFVTVVADLYMQEKQHAQAAEVCRAALEGGLKTPLIYRSYGHALLLLGDRAKAGEVFRSGLALAPQDGYLMHMLAIVENEATARAPEDYVRAVFDSRADSYEAIAMFKLGVRVPGLIRREILRIRPKLDPNRPAAHKLSAVLDIGCGSGLVGAMTYDLTAYLKGVDLSRNLIHYAQLKGVYHELEAADLIASMTADPRLYECVAAGDSLAYFGDLKPVFAAAFKRLLPSGLFVFSIEAGSESWRADIAAGVSKDEYRVQDSGRYSHALPYVEASAKATGFEIVQVWPEVLQSDDGVDLQGYLISLRRPLS
ncbi:MAG: tetratricopeptide repeat protein [Proteobacteria bacterium]|nr:tetratricopeptide repeat protein [Pseudomonadota bacterium]